MMLAPDLLCRALEGISVSVNSQKEFQQAAGILSRSVAREVLDFLEKAGVGTFSCDSISFTSSDRLAAAILCLNCGCDIDAVSSRISWRDFEQLASTALKSAGYQTRTNVRFVKPRMEIDVVGVMSSLALVIDCKHWARTNRSAVTEHCVKQVARTDRLVKTEMRVNQAVPLILTLHAESIKFVEGVPIVPIAQLRSFLQEMQAHLQEIRIVCRS
jgi:hypothetical protein